MKPRTMKKRDFYAGQLALVLLVLGPSWVAADSKKPVPLELDSVSFKENGRFHEKIVAECNIESNLRSSLEDLNKKLRRKASKRVPPPAPIHLALRIDKVGNMGSVGRAGTEIGVTAIMVGSDKSRLFLCGDSGIPGPGLRLTHCARTTHCVQQIAEDVVNWTQILAARSPSNVSP